MKVIKRNGAVAEFDLNKIIRAISLANKDTNTDNQISEALIMDIAESIKTKLNSCNEDINIELIQNLVENELMANNAFELARNYIKYRYERALVRKANTTDETILSLIRNENKELAEENSNKSTILASTQRDYIAGIVSRDITDRLILPKKIAEAHRDGVLHFHDADYFIQPIFNCCLVNIGDMLDNGTVMNGKMIESPKSFQVACTVATQIIAAVASNQYGGQSIDIRCLGKYLRKSKEKFRKKIVNSFGNDLSEDMINKIVQDRLKEELKAGVQTIQYQINTLMTTNGQSPFVTLFLFLDKDDEYIEENAMIIEEILRQRIEGIKNEKGVYVTPAFPKLVYVLDEINNLSGGKYDYVTEMAVKCSAKRMYPDYISAKKMREHYEGNVFSPMGCVDGNEVIMYRYNDTLFVESFKRMWNRFSSIYTVSRQFKKTDEYLYIDLPELVEIYDSKNGFVRCKRLIRNFSEQWMDIRFSNGRRILCTPDHPLPVKGKGRTYAVDLKKHDLVPIISKQYTENNIGFDLDTAWMLGFILCNICNDRYRDYTVSVSIPFNISDTAILKLKNVMNRVFNLQVDKIAYNRGLKEKYRELYLVADGSGKLSNIISALKEFYGGYSESCRHIPNEVFSWCAGSKMYFLAGMVDACGTVDKWSAQIASESKEIALQTLALVQSLGMYGKIYYSKQTQGAKKSKYKVEFDVNKEFMKCIACENKKSKYKERIGRSKVPCLYGEVVSITKFNYKSYSYDVTTESDYFDVSGIYSHNCRSFLAPWKDENGNYKFEGRFNQGVVSINLPQIGIIAKGDEEKFWNLLDERLELCYEALMCRHESCKKILSDVSPVHWQYGALARLDKGESIEPLLYGGYSSISLGYIGLYEVTKLMKGVSHTTPEGEEFALRVMKRLRKATDDWKAKTNIGFALYGTPAESLCYRFARIDKERFGTIEDITDKGYYTNSYHVDVREEIDAFKKFDFESQFQKISSGGAISYVEIPNMRHNIPALKELVKYIYDNIQYAEFNTKSDYCHVCGYDGEIKINDDNEWECPQCGNKDHSKMNVTRRTCGLA